RLQQSMLVDAEYEVDVGGALREPFVLRHEKVRQADDGICTCLAHLRDQFLGCFAVVGDLEKVFDRGGFFGLRKQEAEDADLYAADLAYDEGGRIAEDLSGARIDDVGAEPCEV